MKAKLGAEEMGKENHIFSPAYKEGEFDEILSLCGHIVLNLPPDSKYKNGSTGWEKSGIRVNPQCSTQKEHAIYDPCAQVQAWDSEGAVKRRNNGIEGIHFHTLCEQNSVLWK